MKAGGVRSVHVEGRRVVKVCAVIGEDAVVPERSGGEFVGEFFVDELERFGEIGFAGDAAGNVFAGDQEVYVREKRVDAGIKIVEVGDDGNLRGASPFGGKGCSGGVVAVNEESAGGGNPFALEFGWLEREAFIVAAKDGWGNSKR